MIGTHADATSALSNLLLEKRKTCRPMATIGKGWPETSVPMLCAGDRSSVLSLFVVVAGGGGAALKSRLHVKSCD